jgi:hypothetical protein
MTFDGPCGAKNAQLTARAAERRAEHGIVVEAPNMGEMEP